MQYTNEVESRCVLYPWKHKVLVELEAHDNLSHVDEGYHDSSRNFPSENEISRTVGDENTDASSNCRIGDNPSGSSNDAGLWAQSSTLMEAGNTLSKDDQNWDYEHLSKSVKDITVSSNGIVPLIATMHENVSLSDRLEKLNVAIGSHALPSCIDNFNRINPSSDVLRKSKVNIDGKDITADLLLGLADPYDLDLAHKLIDTLSYAVKVRVKCQASKCHNCLLPHQTSLTNEKDTLTTISATDPMSLTAVKTEVRENMDAGGTCGHARVAVMFSGGIDSLVIAALADR